MPKLKKFSPRKNAKLLKLLQGGEIIGKGGYGCVVGLDKKTVAKINYGNQPMYEEFGIESLEQFMGIQSSIFKIDPTEKYIITTREILRIPSNDLRIKECVKYDKNPQEIYDVYIQTRVITPPPIKEWSASQIQHAIDGLYLLHKNGFVHNDVSLNNFGFFNDMPVFIDMDGASVLKPVRIRNSKKKGLTIDLNETSVFDFQQLNKVFMGGAAPPPAGSVGGGGAAAAAPRPKI